MALIDIDGDIFVPPMAGDVAALSLANMTINAAGEKAAMILRIRKGGTIDDIGFLVGTASNAQDLRVSLQDVDTTTGDPDGTQDQYRTVTGIAANTYFTTGLVTSDGTDMGTKRTVAAGDLLAIVIEFESTVGNLNIRDFPDDRLNVNFPYTNLFTSAWAPRDNAAITHIHYADGSYETGYHLYSMDAVFTTTFNSGSTPDERALKFTLPYDCRISGFWHFADIDNDCDFVIYNAAGTAEETLAITSAVQENPANGRPAAHYFATPVEYTKDTIKRLSMKPGASNSSSYEFETASDALMAGNQYGTNMILSTRVDAGAWTDDANRRPMFGLIIDQVHDDDAGGGGGGGAASVTGGAIVR
jgi:hypothetical protein